MSENFEGRRTREEELSVGAERVGKGEEDGMRGERDAFEASGGAGSRG